MSWSSGVEGVKDGWAVDLQGNLDRAVVRHRWDG